MEYCLIKLKYDYFFKQVAKILCANPKNNSSLIARYSFCYIKVVLICLVID